MNTVLVAGVVVNAPLFSAANETNKNARLTLQVTDDHKWTRKEDNIAKGKTCYHDIIVWGPMAAQYGESIKKGDVLLITGRLEYLTLRDERRGDIRKAQINARQIDVLAKGE